MKCKPEQVTLRKEEKGIRRGVENEKEMKKGKRHY